MTRGEEHTPEMDEVRVGHGLPQAGLGPQPVGEAGIVNLEAVVDSQGHAAFRLSRCGGERELAEKGHIVSGQ